MASAKLTHSSEATLVQNTIPSNETLLRPVLPKLGVYPSDSSGQNAWLPGTPYKYPIPGRGEHWHTCHRLVQKYDKGLCDMWTEEVDKLLIFAGLFSAAVTAFIIESYRWLGPDSTDTTNMLLSQIYLQLNGTGSTIGEISPLPSSSNQGTLLSSAERINICWFLSLTLSLATVLIGILCMQWVREYQHDVALPQADLICLRQMRFEGLVTWKVPGILSSLPLIIQTALILFFVGILDLLWSLNHRVAIPVTIAIGLLLVFVFATTMLPTFQLLRCDRWLQVAQCAYKSPQSWMFYRLVLMIIKCLKPLSRVVRGFRLFSGSLHSFLHCRGWNDYDTLWQKTRREENLHDAHGKQDGLSNALVWIIQNFKQDASAMHAIHHCLQDVSLSAAARVVSALDPRVDERLSSMLKPQLLRSYTGERRFLQPHSELKRDLIMAYFHEIHRPIHPESAVHQLEHVIRLMNSSEHWRLRPYLEWPVHDIYAYPEDIVHEFLYCLVKEFRNSSTFTRSEILGVWKIIQDLSRGLDGRNHSSGETKVLLLSVLIRQLNQWLISPSTHMSLNRSERTKICAQGLIDLFFPWPSMTMDRLKSFHQDITVVYTMIESVNRLLMDLELAGVSGTVLDSSHRDGWLSLNRQLDPSWEEDQAHEIR